MSWVNGNFKIDVPTVIGKYSTSMRENGVTSEILHHRPDRLEDIQDRLVNDMTYGQRTNAIYDG